MRSALAFAAVLLTTTGCFVPRSASYGQTATLLSPNEVEVGLSPGLTYQVNNTPTPTGTGQNVTSTTGGLAFPAFEGNAAVGLTDMLGLNVHLSPAGLQPGVKIGLLKGPLSVAVMPELGVGVWTTASSTSIGGTTTSSGNPSSFFGIVAGFKAIASHEIGAYGGLGYDLQVFTANNLAVGNIGGGQSTDSSTSQTSHNISLAAGYEIKLGGLKIRPELAFMISPAVSVSSSSGNTTVTQSGGSMVYVFPNVTIAAGSGGRSSQEVVTQ